MNLFKQYIYPRLILDIAIFYIPLMALGVLATGLNPLRLEVLLGFFANYLMLVFSFMYNDVADAEADASSEFEALSFMQHMRMNLGMYEQTSGKRRFVNPFSVGRFTEQQGFSILLTILIASVVVSFYVGGLFGFLVALSNLVIGILYSGGHVKFKAMLGVDLLSHSYLLAGVQILYFFTYSNAQVTIFSWGILFGAIIYSMGGDLWNEYRDFDEDQAAGLKNTATTLGKSRTRLANKFMVSFGLLLIVGSVVGGTIF